VALVCEPPGGEPVAVGDPGSGIWRWSAALPVDRRHAVSLAEGDTPLLRLPRAARDVGVNDLYVKNEATNPTGSHKDRLAAWPRRPPRQIGAAVITGASTGNHGAALAAYSAQAGLRCVIFTTPTIADPMRAAIQVMGAQLVEASWLSAVRNQCHWRAANGLAVDVARRRQRRGGPARMRPPERRPPLPGRRSWTSVPPWSRYGQGTGAMNETGLLGCGKASRFGVPKWMLKWNWSNAPLGPKLQASGPTAIIVPSGVTRKCWCGGTWSAPAGTAPNAASAPSESATRMSLRIPSPSLGGAPNVTSATSSVKCH
jgi:Pyridoxal-phosphate dependent enzyme